MLINIIAFFTCGVVHSVAASCDKLAVGFHVSLLEVGCKPNTNKTSSFFFIVIIHMSDTVRYLSGLSK